MFSPINPNFIPVHIPRASASAVAFGMGLLSAKGSLGPARQRAFAVTSESRASECNFEGFMIVVETIRFFLGKRQEPAVDKLKEPVLRMKSLSVLVSRYGLNLTRQDVAMLWFLFPYEATAYTFLGCFAWSGTADLMMWLLKGYGNSINYRQGVPLLEDVVQSMEQAHLKQKKVITSCCQMLESVFLFYGKNIVCLSHLKHDYNSLCNCTPGSPEQRKPVSQ
ncbi:hypothetical protein NC653_022203 [Populus alba x Populus x berolinensis]|uniref:Multiple inositol polyphosphate phosphatase 1 n=1 Tax=Populus alba x Populus x berolinensis TaxID=444605 RepID=A0AAD6VUE5_9ROSI|nr:hypothetical protein NC653_022203 [Populus alba x Populus x berolinensis]